MHSHGEDLQGAGRGSEDAREPIRTCIGCRTRRPVRYLYRVVVTGDERLAVGRNLPGRGAWLCRGSESCWEKARSSGAFSRALRTKISSQMMDELGRALASVRWEDRSQREEIG